MRETVWGIYFADSLLRHISDARTFLDPLWDRYIKLMRAMLWDEQNGAARGDHTDDAALAASMERWNDEVRATIAPERLLVWDPGDGWEPLCAFLEVPVPEDELPRLNDTPAFLEGLIGGSIAAINHGWEQRERAAGKYGVID